MQKPLTGLIAAAYTPMHPDGRLRLETVAPLVDHLVQTGAAGLYVCGSTGEGMSLTGEERCTLTEAFLAAARDRVPVVVQVGHNSLAEARGLAAHAQRAGAAAVSANAPSYFRVTSVSALVAAMAQIAAGAPALPFYYYHIPAFTGVDLDMEEFLSHASREIPNLRGIKYTDQKVFVYQACRQVDPARFDLLWGCDEMLLSALAVGAKGAVGSTYNVAAPLYRRLLDAFAAGDLQQARTCQLHSLRLVQVMQRHGPFHPGMKALLDLLGLPCGPCRLPQEPLPAGAIEAIRRDLAGIGYFGWGLLPHHPLFAGNS